MNKIITSLSALLLLPLSAIGQAPPPGWIDPFPAHHIMDNMYFVGTQELGTFLITTPDGHILMNSNYEAAWPVIQAGIEEMGFDYRDIKILISGHAHPDHIEGDAQIKDLTGAEVVVGRNELAYHLAFRTPGGRKTPIDRVVDDGDTITLGGTTLTAIETPGHTPGCMSWSLELEEDGVNYLGFVECSLNGQYLQYIDNEEHPSIAEDMAATYVKARTIPAEVWVSSHGQFYGMHAKYEQLIENGEDGPNPFLDPEGWQAHVDEFEGTFKAALARQLEE